MGTLVEGWKLNQAQQLWTMIYFQACQNLGDRHFFASKIEDAIKLLQERRLNKETAPSFQEHTHAIYQQLEKERWEWGWLHKREQICLLGLVGEMYEFLYDLQSWRPDHVDSSTKLQDRMTLYRCVMQLLPRSRVKGTDLDVVNFSINEIDSIRRDVVLRCECFSVGKAVEELGGHLMNVSNQTLHEVAWTFRERIDSNMPEELQMIQSAGGSAILLIKILRDKMRPENQYVAASVLDESLRVCSGHLPVEGATQQGHLEEIYLNGTFTDRTAIQLAIKKVQDWIALKEKHNKSSFRRSLKKIDLDRIFASKDSGLLHLIINNDSGQNIPHVLASLVFDSFMMILWSRICFTLLKILNEGGESMLSDKNAAQSAFQIVFNRVLAVLTQYLIAYDRRYTNLSIILGSIQLKGSNSSKTIYPRAWLDGLNKQLLEMIKTQQIIKIAQNNLHHIRQNVKFNDDNKANGGEIDDDLKRMKYAADWHDQALGSTPYIYDVQIGNIGLSDKELEFIHMQWNEYRFKFGSNFARQNSEMLVGDERQGLGVACSSNNPALGSGVQNYNKDYAEAIAAPLQPLPQQPNQKHSPMQSESMNNGSILQPAAGNQQIQSFSSLPTVSAPGAEVAQNIQQNTLDPNQSSKALEQIEGQPGIDSKYHSLNPNSSPFKDQPSDFILNQFVNSPDHIGNNSSLPSSAVIGSQKNEYVPFDGRLGGSSFLPAAESAAVGAGLASAILHPRNHNEGGPNDGSQRRAPPQTSTLSNQAGTPQNLQCASIPEGQALDNHLAGQTTSQGEINTLGSALNTSSGQNQKVGDSQLSSHVASVSQNQSSRNPGISQRSLDLLKMGGDDQITLDDPQRQSSGQTYSSGNLPEPTIEHTLEGAISSHESQPQAGPMNEPSQLNKNNNLNQKDIRSSLQDGSKVVLGDESSDIAKGSVIQNTQNLHSMQASRFNDTVPSSINQEGLQQSQFGINHTIDGQQCAVGTAVTPATDKSSGESGIDSKYTSMITDNSPLKEVGHTNQQLNLLSGVTSSRPNQNDYGNVANNVTGQSGMGNQSNVNNVSNETKPGVSAQSTTAGAIGNEVGPQKLHQPQTTLQSVKVAYPPPQVFSSTQPTSQQSNSEVDGTNKLLDNNGGHVSPSPPSNADKDIHSASFNKASILPSPDSFIVRPKSTNIPIIVGPDGDSLPSDNTKLDAHPPIGDVIDSTKFEDSIQNSDFLSKLKEPTATQPPQLPLNLPGSFKNNNFQRSKHQNSTFMDRMRTWMNRAGATEVGSKTTNSNVNE